MSDRYPDRLCATSRPGSWEFDDENFSGSAVVFGPESDRWAFIVTLHGRSAYVCLRLRQLELPGKYRGELPVFIVDDRSALETRKPAEFVVENGRPLILGRDGAGSATKIALAEVSIDELEHLWDRLDQEEEPAPGEYPSRIKAISLSGPPHLQLTLWYE